ncbi:MAG: membrane protein insertion efficiency factor YidD [Hyphomonas sp.]
MSQPDRSLRRRAAYALLWVYKHGPSQVMWAFGARCQHTPTCSEYGAECVARHGWWPGFWMTLARFLRCRPGGTMGFDPPPELVPDVPSWQPWRMGDWRGPRPDPVEKPPKA